MMKLTEELSVTRRFDTGVSCDIWMFRTWNKMVNSSNGPAARLSTLSPVRIGQIGS